MNLRRRHSIRLIGASTLAAVLALARSQETFPARPVRLIVPFPPGGASDVMGRLLAKGLSERLGQPVVVDNVVGAGGLVGMDRVSKAVPDGYVLGLGNVGSNAVMVATGKAGYDALAGFTPIALTATAPTFLIARRGLGIASVPALVALAKGKAGQLNCAIQGVESQMHLMAAAFTRRAGVPAQFIPYNGSAPLEIALRRGDVEFTVAPADLAKSLADAGVTVTLAVIAEQRLSSMPELPALSEFYPGTTNTSWWGLFGPSGMPPAVTARLTRAAAETVQAPEYARRMTQLGIDAHYSDAAQFHKLIESEVGFWSRITKDVGLKLE